MVAGSSVSDEVDGVLRAKGEMELEGGGLIIMAPMYREACMTISIPVGRSKGRMDTGMTVASRKEGGLSSNGQGECDREWGRPMRTYRPSLPLRRTR